MERGVMLIDSDEERDSNTTTQSEQREEKLQVNSIHTENTHTQTHTEPNPAVSVSAALLGLHPGHADQLGQHDAGPHPLYASDVRRHRTRRHRDGRQRVGGLPAEEGQGASADGLCRRLPTPESQLMCGGAFKCYGISTFC